jgi:(2Fe-2S) ferredoxin
MVPFEKHVFVCTSGKNCPVDGDALGVHARFKALVLAAKLDSSIRINQAGCMAQCGYGPMVVVYPDNVWYAAVKVEDADAIFTEHLLGGQPVERLRFHPLKPGANKKPKAPPPAGRQL